MRHFKITSLTGLAVVVVGLTGCYRYPPPQPPPQPPVPLVNAAPSTPIPTDAPPAPPPIPSLTAASNTAPPSDRIADPVTSAAACGDWHQQSNYGDRWSTASMWWEYSCSEIVSQELNNPCAGGGGACNAECQYCQWETQTRIDYFHWDGTNAVFTGQSYTDSNLGAGDANADEVWGGSDWWDAATAQWYDLSPTITSLTPASGPVGTVVDIQGWNVNGATSVTFDGGYGWFGFAPGSPVSYTIDSNTEIHITVPDWAASGLISVTTPDGTAVSASAFTLTAP